MTERYAAWMAQRLAESEFRVSLFLGGLFVAIIWEALRLWPDPWQTRGRLACLWIGGTFYGLLLTLAICKLVGIDLLGG